MVNYFLFLLFWGITRVMLEVSLVSLLSPSKNGVAFKITIGLMINHY
jgi:hypothetical protein